MQHEPPEPPSDLAPKDAAYWRSVVEQLIGAELWLDVDQAALERYVRTVASVREARRQFAESGGEFVIVGARGQPVRHPLAAMIATLERQAADLGARLMLEPQARSRGRVKPDAPKPKRVAAMLDEAIGPDPRFADVDD